MGTQCLLDVARCANIDRYVQISTDDQFTATLGPKDPAFADELLR